MDRRRVQLRVRVILLSLALFAFLWVSVFRQMVSGHDPVLGRSEARTIWTVDPVTGAIRATPSDSPQASAQRLHPSAPEPVLTSQS
jgi:hypothetical protein